MTLYRVKLGCKVTFMKYFASVVSLIFTPKTLIWNKTRFLVSNSLNFTEFVQNELAKSVSKNFTISPFCTQFTIAYCKNFKSLQLKN